jgi:selenocysteine-specific elongation factor
LIAVPTVVIGTAGHIDHGKTTLLRALTGIDPDRLPEERARGMTIDVGYAHLAFDDGVEVDFVDVPGHDRLIGNMLVGAGEIDAAMLVVAADDGPRPQTIEHLQLLDALDVRDGLAVVTKTDLVDPARVADVVEEVRALLAETSLAAAPVLAASAVSGDGIAAVREGLRALRDTIAASPARLARGPLRLAVDRAFSVQGRGVVVTGSLRGGSVERGAALRREPGGADLRVREVQVHGAAREGHDGGRTALNLVGLPLESLRRGDVLTAGPGVLASDRLLVGVRPPASLGPRSGWPLKPGSRLRLHIGTDQVDATVRRLTGVPTTAILDLSRRVATLLGDRAVLRRPSPGDVAAGVRVLDATPPRGPSRRRLTAERIGALDAAIERNSDHSVQRALVELHGALVADGVFPGTAPATMELAADVRADLEAAAVEAVMAHHRHAPLSPGLPLPRARAALLRRLRTLATVERRDAEAASAAITRLLDRLVEDGRLGRSGDALRDPARGEDRPAALVEAMARLEAALSVAAPPSLRAAAERVGCPPECIRALQTDGRIVRVEDDLAWAADTYHRLAGQVLDRARVAPVTPAELRDATGTSRRYALAILEDLDRRRLSPRANDPGVGDRERRGHRRRTGRPRACAATGGLADRRPGRSRFGRLPRPARRPQRRVACRDIPDRPRRRWRHAVARSVGAPRDDRSPRKRRGRPGRAPRRTGSRPGSRRVDRTRRVDGRLRVDWAARAPGPAARRSCGARARRGRRGHRGRRSFARQSRRPTAVDRDCRPRMAAARPDRLDPGRHRHPRRSRPNRAPPVALTPFGALLRRVRSRVE